VKLQWTKQAKEQLADAIDYVYLDSPEAAERQECLVVQAVKNLQQFPQMGRPGRITSTRELVIAGTPYTVVYEVRSHSIRILAVLHSARRWPSSFKH
jgi:toxin ParE1/3/4